MIQVDPGHRWTAKTYLKYWCPLFFPSYFPYLYQMFVVLSHPDMGTPDQKIRFLSHSYEEIVAEVRTLYECCMGAWSCGPIFG
jgi:hypothetical protein